MTNIRYKTLCCLIIFVLMAYGMQDTNIPGSSSAPTIPYQSAIVDSSGHPTQLVMELIKNLGIETQDNNLSTIVGITQKLWLRPAGKERWEIEEKYPDKHEEIYEAMLRIGCIEPRNPLKSHYDALVFLGGTYARMRERISYMLSEFQLGISCDSIVFLTGQRPLDSKLEENALKLGLKTESDALKYLVTKIPENCEQFNKLNKIYIDVPMIETSEGKLRRPTTGDTFKAWLDTQPQVFSCLLISSQPYVGYQHAVALTYLPSHWDVETIGKQPDETISNADYLDNLARWLYQEQELRKNK